MTCLIRSSQGAGGGGVPYPAPPKEVALEVATRAVGIARNAVSAASGAQASFVVHSQVIPVVSWTILGAQGVRLGYQDLRVARRIGDAEGVHRARASILSGGLDFASSICSIGSLIADSAEAEAAVVGGLGYASSAIFGVGLLVSAAVSTVGIFRTHSFCKAIELRLNQEGKAQKERCIEALQFLKKSFQPTDEERKANVERMERAYASSSETERDGKIEAERSKLFERREREFKRKTSQKALFLMKKECDAVLKKLQNNETGAEERALEFIQEIKKESQKKRFVYAVTLVAAVIGVVSLIMGTFFTAGALPFILGMISTALYVGVMIANYIQYAKNKKLLSQ